MPVTAGACPGSPRSSPCITKRSGPSGRPTSIEKGERAVRAQQNGMVGTNPCAAETFT
jgi:hypothetical protein